MSRDRKFVANMLRFSGRRGWTLKRLAAEAGMPYSTVTNYSHSDASPSLDKLRKLKEALGCTWDDLLG